MKQFIEIKSKMYQKRRREKIVKKKLIQRILALQIFDFIHL